MVVAIRQALDRNINLHLRPRQAPISTAEVSFKEVLPLYHRPGAIVIVDFDREYTDRLVSALPKSHHFEVFRTARSALNHLQQEPPLYEQDFWTHQELVQNWHDGHNLIAEVLQYWRESSARHKLATVCVMDHNQIDALEVLSDLQDWPGRRILTTGKNHEALAITAFNQRLIDQVVVKNGPQSPQQVATVVAKLQAKPNSRYDQIWRSTLTPSCASALGLEGVAQDLKHLVASNMIEWVVIGEPFGILGLNASGAAIWLQLELAEELDGIADLAVQFGASQAEAIQIRRGLSLPDVELQQALVGRLDRTRVVPAFCVGRSGGLLAAVHRIERRREVMNVPSHGRWLAFNSHSRSGNQSNF